MKALAGFVLFGLVALAVLTFWPGPGETEEAPPAASAPQPMPRLGTLAVIPAAPAPMRQGIVTLSVMDLARDDRVPQRLAQADATPRELVDREVRNVTPPGMTPGPDVDGPLVRIPVPPPPPLAPRWQRFFRVVALDAGTLDLGRRKVRLAGIVAPAPDTTCAGAVNPEAAGLTVIGGDAIPPGGLAEIVPGGLGTPLLDIAVIDDAPAAPPAEPAVAAAPAAATPGPEADPATWPCGRAALTAFRMMLRSRAVECFFAADAIEDPVVASCRAGSTDLSEWLVRQGWARPAPDNSDLQPVEVAARCSLRGMWRAEQPVPCPR